MSSSRKLSERIEWSEETRAIELLDWETRPEDFEKLCARIIRAFQERDGLTPEALFELIPEREFRRQVRLSAEQFTERHISLLIYVHLRLKFLVIPEFQRQQHNEDDSKAT